MSLNFPASPTTGDRFTANGKSWWFNGVAWDVVGDTTQAVFVTVPAAVNLSGHRAVKVVNGAADYCDAATQSDAGLAIGMTTGAVVAGDDATIQTVGSITEPSWTWTTGPVFVGFNGGLTQSLVGLTFVQRLGIATSSTTVDLNPQQPIIT